ncbi:MAG TPA: hypothetical protein VMW24_21445 [Sedimentisphaerales bacterium]|nr:hypothetical protein [Sedimentisphaerales bacterium]
MLDRDQIKAILESRKQAAKSFAESELFEVRKMARDYYEGKPFRNEVAGRSQFILTDVRDKIEALMPALMKVFTAGSRLCDFLPIGPEDEMQAREATIGVNHVIMKQNRGFSILETAFKDGLLEKVGITKTWAEEVSTEKTERRTGILGDDLIDLENDENIEILEQEDREITILGQKLIAYDVKIRITGEMRYKIRIGNVVPENFLIDPSAVRLDEADYVAEKMYKSVSDLIEMGVKKSVAENLPTADMNTPNNGQTRDYVPVPAKSDKASRLVAVWWEHAKIDVDEDGKSERWRYLRDDAGKIIMEPEEWDDDWPYQAGCPIPKPHEFYGTSLAEEVMDIQLAKSTIFREWLDNLYGMNNQRFKIFESVPGQVDIDGLLNQDLRVPVRIRSAPNGQADVQPLGNVPIGDSIFPALEYLEGVAEVRTGVSKMGQGLDPNVLHKTPATTAGFMMSLAQEKQALIARVYAETLVRDLCIAVYKLMRKYDNVERSIRLTNTFVQVSPGNWPEEMDLDVNVGLGTGNKMQQAANLQQLSGYMQLGAQQGMVSPDNIYNGFKMAVDSLGFVNPDLYFTDPNSQKGKALIQQMQQRQQQQPDPIEMGRLELEKQKVQAKMQIDQARLILESQEVEAKLGLQKSEIQEKLRLKAQELIQNAQLKLLEIQTEAELEGMELGMEATLKREELAIEARLGARKINVDTRIADPDNKR